MSKNEVAKALNISWTTVNKYWCDNVNNRKINEKNSEKKSGIDKTEKKEEKEPTREEYKKLFTLFDNGRNIIDVIKKTGMGDIVETAYLKYLEFKGYPHPVNIIGWTIRMNDKLSDIKEKMGNLEKLDKRIRIIEEEVKKLVEKDRRLYGPDPY